MQVNILKKWLAIGIILLFVGVTIAPSINFNTVKASPDDEFVEVTTQACGIKGYGATTVKLTRQQYQDIEQYLVEFRARLNQTSTREEAVPLFKDAVVELDKYGLLPKGMSVERAQKLVIGGYQNEILMKRFAKLSEYKLNNSSTLVNYFCLIAGKTNQTVFCPTLCAFFTVSSYLFFDLAYIFFILGIFGMLFGILLVNLAWLSFYFSNLISPIVFGSVYLGYSDWMGDRPSVGWIQTYGLYGNKNIEGSFYGNLTSLRLQILWEWLGEIGIISNFPGISGFLGIKIFTTSTYTQFYLGSALSISISSKPNPPMSYS